MIWSAILGALEAVLNALVKLAPMLAAYKAGQQGERADSLDRGLKGLDDARRAVDDVRLNPGERERLRDKYRVR